jgi:hypothetical protein
MEICERGEDPGLLVSGLLCALTASLFRLLRTGNTLSQLLSAYCCHLPLPLVPAASEPGA